MGSVHQGYGSGVMVGLAHSAAPVAHELLDVEVVGEGFLLAVAHLPHRPLAEGYRRPSRRNGETLLGARVTDVHTPVVHADVHPSQRGNRIHQKERVPLLTGGGYLLDRLKCPSGSFGVDGSRDSKVVRVQLLDELLFVYRSILGSLNLSNLSPLAGRDLHHKRPEVPGVSDESLVARLYKISEHGLHPGHSRRREKESSLILGPEYLAEQACR